MASSRSRSSTPGGRGSCGRSIVFVAEPPADDAHADRPEAWRHSGADGRWPAPADPQRGDLARGRRGAPRRQGGRRHRRSADPGRWDPSLDVATVIWSTGFRPDYRWVKVPGFVGEDGWPMGGRGVAGPSPGLFFLGVPFHLRRSPRCWWRVPGGTRAMSSTRSRRPTVTRPPRGGWHPPPRRADQTEREGGRP